MNQLRFILTLLAGALLTLNLSAASLPVVNLSPNVTSEVIQRTLDALPHGGEVVLAAGKYIIRTPLILRHDHQTLRGSGPATILYLADKANCPVVILGAPVQEPQQHTSHLRLADLSIDGNRKHQQVEIWRTRSDGAEINNNGVDVWAVDDVTVEHVICARCRSGGLVSSAVTRNLTVRDFTAFDNQFDGLACYLTEDSHFSKLYLHDNLGAGISLDLDFNHNHIEDSVLSGNDLGVFMRQSRNNVFEGVTIQQSRHHGVFMA
ncbi:MAG TPA: right-handed parallel beta-helix repeat-containing protein, partial [Candidatus Saccharimonadales bacterium]|nr:right-handed parallel beta-helix repeat-containing protein [Candidatus Saccharimonadales bacterium]